MLERRLAPELTVRMVLGTRIGENVVEKIPSLDLDDARRDMLSVVLWI